MFFSDLLGDKLTAMHPARGVFPRVLCGALLAVLWLGPSPQATAPAGSWKSWSLP